MQCKGTDLVINKASKCIPNIDFIFICSTPQKIDEDEPKIYEIFDDDEDPSLDKTINGLISFYAIQNLVRFTPHFVGESI